MSTSLIMFLTFVGLTLGITYWAAKRTSTAKEFYTAGRSITGFQNGWAVAGDYMSAASFLGIAGLISFYGYDGFMYSVGWLVAYLTVLLIVAEPLRNTGKYTMADVLAFRLQNKSVRTVAAFSTLTVSLFYMIAQMVGAGSLVSLLIPQVSFDMAIVMVGILMLVYVIFGGMLATTWVQIVKAVLLMMGTILLSILVLAKFHFSPVELFDEVAKIKGSFCAAGGAAKDGVCPNGAAPVVKNFTQPGLYYNGPWGALNLISLGIALIFGTAGLPHILVRFYTVPSAQEARKSVVVAMILIGSFYIMTTFLGFGAATLVGKGNIGVHVTGDNATAFIETTKADELKLEANLLKKGAKADEYIKKVETLDPDRAKELRATLKKEGKIISTPKTDTLQAQFDKNQYVVKAPNSNLAAPLLAGYIGGDVFLSFVAAIAFATILAVVAGLTIASSSAFTHDIWVSVVKGGKSISEEEQVKTARITAAVIGIVSILLAIALKTLNVAFLVGLAFAVAASANVPAIVLTLFWRRFNTSGMVLGMMTGLISSLVLICLSPAVMGIDPPTATVRRLIQATAIFPLENPGIISVPLGFLASVLGSFLTRDRHSERIFSELNVRANTGWGAES